MCHASNTSFLALNGLILSLVILQNYSNGCEFLHTVFYCFFFHQNKAPVAVTMLPLSWQSSQGHHCHRFCDGAVITENITSQMMGFGGQLVVLCEIMFEQS